MRGATSSICCRDGNNRISTPAPAWGATPYTVEQMRYLVFQLSHPVRGATQTTMCFPPHIQKLAIKFFNSRTPRGVRPGSAWIQTGFSHFNSHTRVGCDNTDRSSLHNGLVFSTHAPHEGCDWNFRATRPWSEFQLTHSMHGCDRHGRVWRRETCHFNSRTRVGCDA